MVPVERVTPVEGYRLRVGFSDGTERVIDVEPYLRGPIFDRVRKDRGFFEAVEVDRELGNPVGATPKTHSQPAPELHMSPAEELESAALALPRAERARLATRLLASLDDDPEIDSAWRRKVRERLAEYRAGEAETYPAEDVMKEARDRFGRRS